MIKSCKKSCYKVNPAFYPGVLSTMTQINDYADKSFYDIVGRYVLLLLLMM